MKQTEPYLMPFQDQPFNGDTFLQKEVLRLRDQFKITWAIETGSCLYYTSVWLAEHFREVDTIEVNRIYYDLASGKLPKRERVFAWQGDSAKILDKILQQSNAMPLIFLDAHWGRVCPLKKELALIAASGKKPVIVIHDFKVPGKDFGFDSFKGQPFNWKWVAPDIQAIYGDRFDYKYNEQATGAKRGVLFTWPT